MLTGRTNEKLKTLNVSSLPAAIYFATIDIPKVNEKVVIKFRKLP
jgi:hypothetical protein